MSFVAITYGYNQFSIFNTNVWTYPLIDNIISVCFDEIAISLQSRLSSLTKEIEAYNQDEESLKKVVKQLEANKQKEEEKAALEAKNVVDLAPKDPKKGTVPAKPNPTAKVAPSTKPGEMSTAINLILEELKSTDTKLQVCNANKDKSIMKKKLLLETMDKYKAVDKSSVKIDLTDMNGERMNMSSKGDVYSNQYLLDRQVYELNKLTQTEKNETVLDPVKFDGFCMRTLEEDIKWEEFEKTNKNNKKTTLKKK